MAVPTLPWYNKLKEIVAPTEGAANLALIVIIVILLVLLLKGSALSKAAAVVWVVSP
jgi:hypothetical protein